MTAEESDGLPPLARQAWPAGDLEAVGRCPVCGTADRTILHPALWDNSFHVAPGSWTLWSCGGCASAYLDPRPTPASIGRAYEQYYTHDAPVTVQPPLNRLQRLRVALSNGYRNRRYGTGYEPSLPLGYWLGRATGAVSRNIDLQFRFAARPKRVDRPRLLDIGCGAGAFLQQAKAAGWDCHGVDFDPAAVAGARSRGLDVVEGSIDAVAGRGAWFDAITMSHVIEHVHDPVAFAASALALLKPGGTLYIETPNIEALGHRLYGPNWRGLETPRHLVLFNARSLAGLLANAGFTEIRSRRDISRLRGVGLESAKMAAGVDRTAPDPAIPPPPLSGRLRAAVTRRHAEFLVFTAAKPAPAPASPPPQGRARP
jgi:2-polyprenyl-3-methyl-5-hydroxy-6-metoxy-1,4-benzoquinol methylase